MLLHKLRHIPSLRKLIQECYLAYHYSNAFLELSLAQNLVLYLNSTGFKYAAEMVTKALLIIWIFEANCAHVKKLQNVWICTSIVSGISDACYSFGRFMSEDARAQAMELTSVGVVVNGFKLFSSLPRWVCFFSSVSFLLCYSSS